jgi:hypothetical protein
MLIYAAFEVARYAGVKHGMTSIRENIDAEKLVHGMRLVSP